MLARRKKYSDIGALIHWRLPSLTSRTYNYYYTKEIKKNTTKIDERTIKEKKNKQTNT